MIVLDTEKEYIPTTAEKKLLEVLMEPENYTIPISKLCEKAGIGRNTYYHMCKKPEFIKKRNEILDNIFKSFVPEVKKAAVKYAINNAKNFQDRKMILEMTGEYKPSQDINLNSVSDSEIEKELKEFDKNIKKK